MILSEQEASARLNNPLNLINRIATQGKARDNSSQTKRSTAMSLFGINKTNVQIPQSSSAIAANEVPQKPSEVKQEETKLTFNPFKKLEAIEDESDEVETNQALVKAEGVENSPLPLDQSSKELPGVDDLIDGSGEQIKLGLAHDAALSLLTDSVKQMQTELTNISPSKLPSVIAAASKVVESIRKERLEANKIGKDKQVHYHFYTPVQKKVTDYEVIEVQ